MSFYYDYSKINSYHCPLIIVVSMRGLGKTFGKLKEYVEKFLTKGYKFIYVVETGEMVKELTKNNGDKFFCALIEYYSEQDSSRKKYFYNKLTSVDISEEDETTENGEVFKRNVNAKLLGGAIKINGETAGYIVDMNSYGEIKRNNFNGVKHILVDEFISEKMDKTTLENPKKISSILQSVARLRDVKVCLLGNAIRFDDPILSRMGFKLTKYGFYKRYDKHGLFAVLHFVDPDDYPDFKEAHDKSVAGRFSCMIGETNEEENKFLSNLPDVMRLRNTKYRKNGYYINIVKNDIIVTIRELENGHYACVPFSNFKTVQNLYCLTEREQGYKLGYHIICNKMLKQTLQNMLRAGCIEYYSEVEYSKLKSIIQGV